MVEEIKIGGNGHDPEKAKEILTPEELKRNRLERFTQDPDSFVELSELIAATKVGENGIEIYTNPASTRDALMRSVGELIYNIQKRVATIELMAMQNKRIVQPKPRIKDIFRRR